LSSFSPEEKTEFNSKYGEKINQITRKLDVEVEIKQKEQIKQKETTDHEQQLKHEQRQQELQQKEKEMKEIKEKLRISVEAVTKSLQTSREEIHKFTNILSNCETICDIINVLNNIPSEINANLMDNGIEFRDCLLGPFLRILSKENNDIGKLALLLNHLNETEDENNNLLD
jgi:hypothetical protein